MKLLFVCTANTCRSPMAEGLVRYFNEKYNMNHISLSAGLAAFPGDGAMTTAITAVAPYVDISSHQSRPVTKELIEAADLVILMTKMQKEMLLKVLPAYKDKYVTLAEWAGETKDVADPFGWDQEFYDETATQIMDYLEKALLKEK